MNKESYPEITFYYYEDYCECGSCKDLPENHINEDLFDKVCEAFYKAGKDLGIRVKLKSRF